MHISSCSLFEHTAYCSQDPGYSCEMLESSVQTHQYPEGDVWKLHVSN